MFNYETLTTNKKYPKYNKDRHTIYTKFDKPYRFYLEVRDYNTDYNTYNYYILLGETKFDENCKSITFDDYGRSKIRCCDNIHNEIMNCLENKNTFDLIRENSNEEYDLYSIQ